MGLFDLASPLLSPVDQLLAMIFPAWLRLLFWGFVAAMVTMLLFKKLSRQEAIAELKLRVKTNQAEMAAFDGELSELMPLIGKTLKLAFRQLGLSLGPALLSSIPVIFLLVWLSNSYAHHLPVAGDTVAVQLESGVPVIPPELDWQPAAGLVETSEQGWLLRWPSAGQTVQLREGPLTLLSLPLSAPVPVLHKKQWWNSLIANPAGYLPAAASISAVRIELSDQTILAFGPGWMQGWMFTFFLAFLVFAVALKFILKIE